MSAAAGDDDGWMRAALAEGELGLGHTSPNPAVGCVLVKNGREMARGHHRRAGLPHAEAEALARAGSRARGCTAYVTLEPCAHHGRTPPCADALIAAGVSRVVVGCRDVHAVVAGKGMARLRRAGIEVRERVLERECRELVRGFDSIVTTGRPFVHLKLAATLDGRIAARGGESRWITGAQARGLVQLMRARAEAIMVGVGTVLADDPRLTCRIRGASSPMRVVLDPKLQTPPDARVVRGRGRALIIGSPSAPASRRRRLESAGAEVLTLRTRGEAGWGSVLVALAERGVMEVLIEGGASVAASAIVAGVVRRFSIFYNPRLMGGDGVAMVGALGVRHPQEAPRLRTLSVQSVGADLLWEGELS
ncbi:MAG TPA: bifunctional diaminohydroxyphosphoribosylaminopyrimidine deaminase/5-amino-6-(5-phosphoribosylamino)uracil reductase RibD [Candidatus Binatia bacterium]|nr:bifunctional diaminohydroxyphosphoribosylaminopyrimidine deaminase/5-amino-6-(5-phosphoribosylamino)uracil reductase RibD [Candidatus Binatia bacterium]